MGNYDRGRGDRSGGGRGFSRGGFNSPRFAGGAGDRGSRGPVEMHQAVCDNCKKSCEVPFRPTSGKPIYCSSCFGHNRDSDSRSGRPSSGWEDRGSRSEDVKEMFDTVCDECGNSCQVPFKPSSGKPVYCSNCFGEKKNASPRNDKGDLAELNAKLDQILAILSPKAVKKEAIEEVKKDVVLEEMPIEETPVVVEKKVRKSSKKSSDII